MQHRSGHIANFILWSACLLVWATLGYGKRSVDLILKNSKIVTVDKASTIAQAVAVTGNTITAVGIDTDVMKLAGSSTQVIDLKGRTVVPGVMDTHHHYSGLEYGGNLTEPQRAVYS